MRATLATRLNIRDYVRLAAPEPEVLWVLGDEAKRDGTDKLTSRQINAVVKEVRAAREKR